MALTMKCLFNLPGLCTKPLQNPSQLGREFAPCHGIRPGHRRTPSPRKPLLVQGFAPTARAGVSMAGSRSRAQGHVAGAGTSVTAQPLARQLQPPEQLPQELDLTSSSLLSMTTRSEPIAVHSAREAPQLFGFVSGEKK